MRIIKRRSRRPLYLGLVVILLASYTYWALHKPLPALQPVQVSATLTKDTGSAVLAWPPAGQSAAGVMGSDILETHGEQKAMPIASVAKVITALVVLDKKPLVPGQPGPVITLTANDVAIYKNYAAQDSSLIPVAAGEKLSEYQMLQALMLPSANNIADTMAIWAFGSLNDYSAAANAYLAKHDLDQTHVGKDASGLDASTTSTARDLVRLGELAMQNQVLADIAGQSTATGIPLTTSVKNVNSLLGTDGIIGIKTGNSDAVGGAFLSASKTHVNGQPVTVITAVIGSPTLFVALKDSLALIRSAQANFRPVTVVTAGQEVGSYKVPWGGTIPAVAASDLTTTSWQGSYVRTTIDLHQLKKGQLDAGTVSVDKQKAAIKLKTTPKPPSALWRLTHLL